MAKSRAEIIKRVEELEDHYILQALLNNFRKTGEPRFFNILYAPDIHLFDYSARIHMVSTAVTQVKTGGTFGVLEVITVTDALPPHITLRLNFWKL